MIITVIILSSIISNILAYRKKYRQTWWYILKGILIFVYSVVADIKIHGFKRINLCYLAIFATTKHDSLLLTIISVTYIFQEFLCIWLEVYTYSNLFIYIFSTLKGSQYLDNFNILPITLLYLNGLLTSGKILNLFFHCFLRNEGHVCFCS